MPAGSHGPMGGARNKWDLRLNDKVPVELNVDLGAGKSTLVLGSLSLTNLAVNLGVGETHVDLTGDWKNDLVAGIHGGVNKATVRLPVDVGVRVHATGDIGQIRADNLKQDDDTYVNDAYGKSKVTLHVDVQGGIGEINLELGEAPPVV